jgi:hypothetical protein
MPGEDRHAGHDHQAHFGSPTRLNARDQKRQQNQPIPPLKQANSRGIDEQDDPHWTTLRHRSAHACRKFGYDIVPDGDIQRLVPNTAEQAAIEQMKAMRRDFDHRIKLLLSLSCH